jgi:AcrR family transcriptional regulator
MPKTTALPPTVPSLKIALKIALKSTKNTSSKNQSTIKPRSRTRDAQATAANILEVAAAEFAEKGLAGARVDEIAALTKTSKRMIYYYFQSKEGLYLAVLEESYRRTREAEASLRLDDLAPLAALKKLVEFSVDYKLSNPNFTRLVMIENIHKATYLARSKRIEHLNTPAIEQLRSIYQRGLEQGVFRAGLDAVALHRAISALSIFNVSNAHTFSVIFKQTTDNEAAHETLRRDTVALMTRFMSV